MEMLNELQELNFRDRSPGDQIMREELFMQDLLCGSESPFLSPWKSSEQETRISPDKLISRMLYAGPAMADMSMSRNNGEFGGHNSYRSVIAMPEKGLSAKMESKYTLRIKTYGSGVADDGYKWRKYGQKSIKNSPNPRSYYRCTNPRCNAKRQVERSTEDPDMMIITYEGLHLHYTYSHFLHSQTNALSVAKKPKTNTVAVQTHLHDQDQQTQSIVLQHPVIITGDRQQESLLEVHKFANSAMRAEIMQEEVLYNNNNNGHCSQGLLEDIVPLMVRKPCSPATSSNEPSYPSQASSPSYSSSLCWTPETFHFAEGVLSSIV